MGRVEPVSRVRSRWSWRSRSRETQSAGIGKTAVGGWKHGRSKPGENANHTPSGEARRRKGARASRPPVTHRSRRALQLASRNLAHALPSSSAHKCIALTWSKALMGARKMIAVARRNRNALSAPARHVRREEKRKSRGAVVRTQA